MNGLKTLNRYFSDLGGKRFMDTASAVDVRRNFFESAGADVVFLFPQPYQLEAVRQEFENLKHGLGSKIIKDLEFTATYENGDLLDLHTQYNGTENPKPLFGSSKILADSEIMPLLNSFENITAPCYNYGNYVIKFYGGRVEGTADWHKDDSGRTDNIKEVIGILPLDKPHLTTRFPGLFGDIRAPKNTVCFMNNNARHRDAGEERPTLQIYNI